MIETLRRLPRLEFALVLLAVVVLTIVGVAREQAKERAEVKPDSYSTLDSTSGGYRAWYELLQREGVRVDRYELRAAFLDRSLQTLIWADPLPFDDRQEIPTESDVQALEAWVRAGGRFVYLGHDDAAAAEGILNLPHSTSAGKRAPYVAPAFVAAGVVRYPVVTVLRWAAKKRPVLLADRQGALVVSYPFGKGHVVAAIDEAAFTNANISRPDRARLAYALAAPQAGTTIAFDEAIHGFSTPEHWWNVVPRPFAIAIWSALGIVLIAFAGAALRLGPPVIPRTSEPTSAAFLDALAALLERGHATRKALTDAAASARRSVTRALGLTDELAPERIAASIEEPEQRRRFSELERISSNGTPDEKQFVAGVALAQHLRKEWTAHARSRN